MRAIEAGSTKVFGDSSEDIAEPGKRIDPGQFARSDEASDSPLVRHQKVFKSRLPRISELPAQRSSINCPTGVGVRVVLRPVDQLLPATVNSAFLKSSEYAIWNVSFGNGMTAATNMN